MKEAVKKSVLSGIASLMADAENTDEQEAYYTAMGAIIYAPHDASKAPNEGWPTGNAL